MWRGNQVSVILPTYNEKDSIRRSIEDFLETGVVDEVLVVNNNAAAGTSDEVALTGAREVFEPRQGYGFAIQRGLGEAVGDYLVVCEPDGTFLARDLFKLLVFADDVDIVYGTRTINTFIWTGANMGFILRFGNWAVAKFIEVLFNSVSLSDVGCTMRLIRRSALGTLQPQFKVGGSAFGLEMMLLSLVNGLKVVQIPVNYLPRVGESSVTGDIRKAISLGMGMTLLVCRFWIKQRLGLVGVNSRAPQPAGPGAAGGGPN